MKHIINALVVLIGLGSVSNFSTNIAMANVIEPSPTLIQVESAQSEVLKEIFEEDINSDCWCEDWKSICVGWANGICTRWPDQCVKRLCK